MGSKRLVTPKLWSLGSELFSVSKTTFTLRWTSKDRLTEQSSLREISRISNSIVPNVEESNCRKRNRPLEI